MPSIISISNQKKFDETLENIIKSNQDSRIYLFFSTISTTWASKWCKWIKPVIEKKLQEIPTKTLLVNLEVDESNASYYANHGMIKLKCVPSLFEVEPFSSTPNQKVSFTNLLPQDYCRKPFNLSFLTDEEMEQVGDFFLAQPIKCFIEKGPVETGTMEE